MEEKRCGWARQDIEIDYHDKEWGYPEHSDQKLFELLILEGMQAGLSWITILKKRENMRSAFDGFDPVIVASYTEEKKAGLLTDAGIIRNRAKINALVENAVHFLEIQQEFGTFDQYIWSFTDGKPLVNKWTELSQLPAFTSLSDTLSKDLKKRGFKFVGSTICYSYMEAIGMINDHIVSCPRHQECILSDSKEFL